MTAFLTPWSLDLARRVGTRAFRKKILPVGEITYEGKRIRFDRPFLQTLVESFRNGAYDQVPFQLATADNRHNNDPERFRGEVTSLDLGTDGLYATVSTTDEGAKLIADNPKLGISARIINMLERADGQKFTAAMQHVLGTLDPKVNGLGAWQAIEASNPSDSGQAIDLSGLEFQEAHVPGQPQFTDAELEQLRGLLARGNGTGNADGGDPGAQDNGETDDDLTDEQLDELIAAAEAFEAGDLEIADEGEEEIPDELAASVNPRVQQELLLARAERDAQAVELSRIRGEMDDARWATERDMFMHQYGIPPATLDLAEELLKGEGHVIDLSNGSQVDAGAVMRRVLTSIGEQVKLLDLSGELGSATGADEDDQVTTARNELVAGYRALTGI